MGVHNGQQHVTAAIESVLAQTFTAFELLIVDDRSTDQTPGMLAQWAKRDARGRVVRQEHAGLTAALNRARALPRGEYLARQDADDLSRPDRFASQVDYLDAHPAIAVVAKSSSIRDPQVPQCSRPFRW